MRVKKYWYIWLSIPAFIFLTFGNSAIRILWHERKNKIGVMDKESVWLKFLGNTLGLWLVFVMGVAFLLHPLLRLIASNFEAGSLFARVFGDLLLLVLYFSGVYATYRHVRWREKNIPHLLKSKQEENEEKHEENETK